MSDTDFFTDIGYLDIFLMLTSTKMNRLLLIFIKTLSVTKYFVSSQPPLALLLCFNVVR